MVRYLHHIGSHSYQVLTSGISSTELWAMMTFHIFGYVIITQTTNNILLLTFSTLFIHNP
jgi:hypothetical protein